MANENGVSKGRIFFGSAIVIIILGLLFAWIFGAFASSVPVETTKRVTQTQSWKKSVDKILFNHEKRIAKLEKKDKEQDFRLDKHADAISDLQEQINGINQPKKENKYKKGWDCPDYPDFPENW
ncbi:MAG: hypothetical protein WC842_02825 [Candidatus Paceibacterota bacterium]|jgi:peptidoglycan hydrolase CwlO-like protein